MVYRLERYSAEKIIIRFEDGEEDKEFNVKLKDGDLWAASA